MWILRSKTTRSHHTNVCWVGQFKVRASNTVFDGKKTNITNTENERKEKYVRKRWETHLRLRLFKENKCERQEILSGEKEKKWENYKTIYIYILN